MLLSAGNVTMVGVTNADRLIDDIQSAAPWTKGDCDIWSGAFLGVMVAVSLASIALAARAPSAATGPDAPSKKVPLLIGLVLLVYWIGVWSLGGMTCIEN